MAEVVRLLVLIASAISLGACNSCTPATSPATDQSVYDELVAAKCLAQTDAGPADLAAQRKLTASPNYPWIACLYDGGTVQSCAVPNCPRRP